MDALRVILSLAIFAVVSAREISQHEKRRVPKQISKGHVLDDEDEDRKAEGTGFESFGGFDGGGSGGEGGGKYFMYQHLPKKDHYEFGFKRGNEHHFIERHEKAHPHVGHFKTKVKWGDKHGGHGEHYWDYNHDGHHGDEGGDEADEASDKEETYKSPDEERRKREGSSSTNVEPPPALGNEVALTYDTKSRTVTDRNTGQVYVLFPIQ